MSAGRAGGRAARPALPLSGASRSSAVDTRTGAKVAIKKLYRPFQSELFAKRAYRELRLLKHMRHDNVSRAVASAPRPPPRPRARARLARSPSAAARPWRGLRSGLWLLPEATSGSSARPRPRSGDDVLLPGGSLQVPPPSRIPEARGDLRWGASLWKGHRVSSGHPFLNPLCSLYLLSPSPGSPEGACVGLGELVCEGHGAHAFLTSSGVHFTALGVGAGPSLRQGKVCCVRNCLKPLLGTLLAAKSPSLCWGCSCCLPVALSSVPSHTSHPCPV